MSGTRAALAWCFSLYRKWATVRNRSTQGPVFTQNFVCSKYSPYTDAVYFSIILYVCLCLCARPCLPTHSTYNATFVGFGFPAPSAAEYKNTGRNWKGLLSAEVREFRSVDI